MTYKRIIAFFLALSVVLTMAGCVINIPSGNVGGGSSDSGEGSGSSDGQGDSGGSVEFPDSDTTDVPDEWHDSASGVTDAVSVRVFLDTPHSLVSELDPEINTDALTWSVRCEDICTVDAGVVTGLMPGRTEVTAYENGNTVARFSVTVEFMIPSNNGYTIITDLVDGETVSVDDLHNANRLLDIAIAEHKQSITMDFSGISEDFTSKDFELAIELGNHVTLRTAYYESTPYIIRFEIAYVDNVANSVTPQTDENTFLSVTSGNAVARRMKALLNSERYTERSDSFNDFPINTVNRGEWEVYNSEELWWAVEQGYKPVFPIRHSKAELFYERAKMILREIILEGMSEYEKAMAIYEYLIDAVAYDYDAYYTNVDKDNVCYYLEGVFENGRAVCDGKSKAFVLLCGMEGIRCLRDYGSSKIGDVGHAWNYVSIDGVWYLVDTTAGDSNFALPGGIAGAFGNNIEVTTYSAFLAALDYHSEEYEYSGIWSEIFIESDYASLADTFFDNAISDGCDFRINDKNEMIEIFTAVIDDGGCNSFTLIFNLADPEVSPFRYIDGFTERFGVEISLYTVTFGDGEAILAAVVPYAD